MAPDRGSTDRAAIVAAVVVFAIAAVAALPPLAAAIAAAATGASDATTPGFPLGPVLARTVGWSAAVGAVGALAGWLPGRRLAAPHRTVVLAAAVLALALPGWLLFFGFWQAVGPGTTIGDWAATHDATMPLRELCLLLGLTAASWPLAAWCVAVERRAFENARGTLAALAEVDGLSRTRRAMLALREDLPALLRGGVAVALVLASSTVAFDLAGVRTFGFELRTLDADGASPAAVVRAGWPGLLPGALLVALAASLPRSPAEGDEPEPRRLTRGRAASALAVALVMIPLGLLLWGLLREPGVDAESVRAFFLLHGESLLPTAATAIATAATVAMLAAGLYVLLARERGRARTFGLSMCVAFAVLAGLPVALAGSATILAWNRPVLERVYDSEAIVVIGLVGRFGVVAAATAWWLSRTRPDPQRMLRMLDAPERLRDQARAERPRLLAVSIASGVVTASLALGEVALSGRLAPAGHESLATAVLNAIHYQRGETVVLATLAMTAMGLIAAAVVVGLARSREALRNVAAIVLFAGLASFSMPGCGGTGDSPSSGAATEVAERSGIAPLPQSQVVGGPGSVPGRFRKPRAVAIDPRDGSYWIVDRTGRVQQLDGASAVIGGWEMPEFERGFPTGITLTDDRVWVPDTHYHRVIAFDREGREQLRFGQYGTEPGSFIYPTDVLVLEDGTIFVSEYGGADRVQAFAPDGTLRFSFDGSETGQRFRRPQSMTRSRDGSEIFIADSCNHRVVVVGLDGGLHRVLGSLGRGLGEFAYPYGLATLPDGSILVSEFGSNRIQVIDAKDGRGLAIWGGFGEGDGHLKYPWAVDERDGTVAVLDTGNNRLMIAPLESLLPSTVTSTLAESDEGVLLR